MKGLYRRRFPVIPVYPRSVTSAKADIPICYRFLRQIYRIALIALMLTGPAYASTPIIWEQSSQRDFSTGKTTRVSIDSQGHLTLAPMIDPLHETLEPLIWCMASDSRGNIYAGTGNDGKLFKIDPSGRGTVFFDAQELEIHSVVVDDSDHVFVATFPEGKVYKLTPAGQSSVFFDPDEGAMENAGVRSSRYLWALVLDKSGNLYIGAGEQGRIYKIDRSGRSSLLAETGETHVVSLAVDQSGNIIAGTDPNGRIFRITPAGRLSVLYDAPYREIHALVVDPAGTIYAGALNEPRITPRGSVQQPATTVTSTPSGATGETDVGVIEVTATSDGGTTTTGFRPPRSGGGMVYRIDPDGVVMEWWQSRDEVGMALALRKDGNLLIGTSPNGRLYAVRKDGQSTTLAQISEPQITAFVANASNQWAMAASNLGKVYRLGAQPAREGIFESEVRDTRGASMWGRIAWTGIRPPGAGIQLFARSGNTDLPDPTWSEWTGPYANPEGDALTCPPARYIQWKAVMTTKTEGNPQLSSVSIAYLSRNIAPVVRNITIYEPGVYLRDASGEDREEEDLPPRIAAQMANRAGNRRQTAAGAPAYRTGMRAVTIEASDDNDDGLRYSLYFRGDQETQWKLLKEDMDRPGYSWDSETFPDGFYTIKAIVNDAPSNPQNFTLQGEMESAPFLVDNTAPQIVNLVSERRMVTFTVQDAASPVYKVEYAIDGGEWRIVYPRDGVSDAKTESFEVSLTGVPAGEHTMAIRAKDTSNNVGTGKRVMILP